MKTNIPRNPKKSIAGADWNALVNRRPGRLELGGTPGERNAELEIRNDCVDGSSVPIDLERFDVVKLGDPVVVPATNEAQFKDAVVLKGETPDAAGVPFAVLQEPAKAGDRAQAMVIGVTPVRVHGTGAYADVTGPSGAAYLECGTGGPARVLWSESGTGERWGLVLLGDRKTSASEAALRAFFTIQEYDPVSGDIITRMDRGRPRSGDNVIDTNVLFSSDSYLYAAGQGYTNDRSGMLVKYDPADGSTIWKSTVGSLHNNGTAAPAGLFGPTMVEASDGAIWTLSTVDAAGKRYVCRHDPATGAQSHEDMITTGTHAQLVPADNGAVIVVYSALSSGTKWLRRLDATATETHTYGTQCLVVEKYGTKLYCITGSTGNGLAILNEADLSVADSRSVPVGETYVNLCTDGTTVWTIAGTTGSANKWRAYSASALATENWNASRTSNGTPTRLIHAGSYIYEFGTNIKKISDSTGATSWTSTGSGSPKQGFPASGPSVQVSLKNGCALGSDFIVVTSSGNTANAANVWCLEQSDGSARWYDQFNGAASGGRAVFVTGDDRVFVAGSRTQP